MPINPFMSFGYFLSELVDRNTVRNGNNNVLKRCDELWVYGDVSDGVLAEIQMFKAMGKPIRYFHIGKQPDSATEVTEAQLVYEPGVDAL